MRKYILFSVVGVMLAGCAKSNYHNEPNGIKDLPNTKVAVETEILPMSRDDVISAIEECTSAKLRPVLVKTYRKINGFPVRMVVDVTCAPRSY